MDELVIEKYIETSIDILYADRDPHSYSVTIQQKIDWEHVHIFIAKDITKKLTL